MEVARKTECQTKIIEDGNKIVFQDKAKFETLDDAIVECKRQNLIPTRTEKVVPYKCKVCHTYHVGRNGTIISEKYREKLIKEKREEKRELFNENLRNADFKVLGTVDLNKFDTTVKIRKNGSKKTVYK